MTENTFENPLTDRYASYEMIQNWSPQKKFSTWRQLWLVLAKAEKQLGLDISNDQITEMETNLNNIDFDLAQKKEKELRHDVMSHIFAYGVVCPKAKPIIHLGATSCFVTDNSELILIRDSLKIIRKRLLNLISSLKSITLKYRDLPTLGFTHYQPAQLTTVGKRMSLWLYDFLMDFDDLTDLIRNINFRGVKGTTGTQGSYLALFEGDGEKVKKLDVLVSEFMGFDKSVPVCGQTYSRKVDYKVMSILSGIAQSAYKMAGDIRHLMNLKEVDEPFEKGQVGSSAMAYKRNPMRSERICSLARYVISLPDNAANTHAGQWFERTLDDSANRRIILPESTMAVDAILVIAKNITDGLVVWPNVIKKHVLEELPFMATEVIIMAAVKAGGDRQELHEAIRIHSIAASNRVKEEGVENDLLDRLSKDNIFKAVHDNLPDFVDPQKFIGRSSEQVDEFVDRYVDPVLERNKHLLDDENQELTV